MSLTRKEQIMNIYTGNYEDVLSQINESKFEGWETIIQTESERAEFKFIRLNRQLAELTQDEKEKEGHHTVACKELTSALLPSFNNCFPYSKDSDWRGTPSREDVLRVQTAVARLILQQTETLVRVAVDSKFADKMRRAINWKEESQFFFELASSKRKALKDEIAAEVEKNGGRDEVEKQILARYLYLKSIVKSIE